MKRFADLSEQEILALAISNEDDDSRIYRGFAEGLRDAYPASAKVFDEMSEEESRHRNMLFDLYKEKFGEYLPLIRRQDVKGFISKTPLWLVRPLPLEDVRKFAENMEYEAGRFYRKAAETTRDVSTRKLLTAIDPLVIDEISMVNADVMDAIDRSLRQARGRRAEPFGGVQIVMFGDPYQLAPVPPRHGDEQRYIRDHYRSFWFFDAKVWVGDVGGDGIIDIGSHGAQLHVRELAEIHRQADPEFKAMLNAVRHGVVTADIAKILKSKFVAKLSLFQKT